MSKNSDTARFLRLPMTVAALFYIAAAFTPGHAGDLAFWRDWILDLTDGSFVESNANYPPVLLEWLYLVGKVYRTLDIPVHADEFLKLWLVLPLLLTHLLVLRVLGRSLSEAGSDPMRTPLFWGLALSPVVWLNGPVWGQVDLLPLAAILPALYCCTRNRIAWVLPLFVLALSVKFQAVVFAPLLAGFGLRYWRAALKGIPVAVGLFLLAWAPYILEGRLLQALDRAYLGNLTLYPYATFNAGNLWYLLSGNRAPDAVNLLTGEAANGVLEGVVTAKGLGSVLFACLSVWIFWRAWRGRASVPSFDLAVLAVVGFFALSPGMHERYLFMAVPLAALWGARERAGQPWFWILSVLAFLNMSLVRPFEGDFVWSLVAWGSVASLVLLALGQTRARLQPGVFVVAAWFERRRGLAWLLAIAAWAMVVVYLGETRLPRDLAAQGGVYLSDLNPERSEQQWGVLRFDRSAVGGPLRIGMREYRKGLGTHAYSEIEYRIPDGMNRIDCSVGLDNEKGRLGRVRFKLLVDGQVLWESRVHQNRSRAEHLTTGWEKGERLILRVDPLGANTWDHANWVDCFLSPASAD